MRQLVVGLYVVALAGIFGCNHLNQNAEQHPIVVDYNQSLSQMIDRSNCIAPWHRVTEQTFPLHGVKTREAVVVVFKVNELASAAEMLKYFEYHGLRPAKIEELLAVAENHPHLIEGAVTISLGSVSQADQNQASYPSLEGRGGSCILVVRPDKNWDTTSQFLAVMR